MKRFETIRFALVLAALACGCSASRSSVLEGAGLQSQTTSLAASIAEALIEQWQDAGLGMPIVYAVRGAHTDPLVDALLNQGLHARLETDRDPDAGAVIFGAKELETADAAVAHSIEARKPVLFIPTSGVAALQALGSIVTGLAMNANVLIVSTQSNTTAGFLHEIDSQFRGFTADATRFARRYESLQSFPEDLGEQLSNGSGAAYFEFDPASLRREFPDDAGQTCARQLPLNLPSDLPSRVAPLAERFAAADNPAIVLLTDHSWNHGSLNAAATRLAEHAAMPIYAGYNVRELPNTDFLIPYAPHFLAVAGAIQSHDLLIVIGGRYDRLARYNEGFKLQLGAAYADFIHIGLDCDALNVPLYASGGRLWSASDLASRISGLVEDPRAVLELLVEATPQATESTKTFVRNAIDKINTDVRQRQDPSLLELVDAVMSAGPPVIADMNFFGYAIRDLRSQGIMTHPGYSGTLGVAAHHAVGASIARKIRQEPPVAIGVVGDGGAAYGLGLGLARVHSVAPAIIVFDNQAHRAVGAGSQGLDLEKYSADFTAYADLYPGSPDTDGFEVSAEIVAPRELGDKLRQHVQDPKGPSLLILQDFDNRLIAGTAGLTSQWLTRRFNEIELANALAPFLRDSSFALPNANE